MAQKKRKRENAKSGSKKTASPRNFQPQSQSQPTIIPPAAQKTASGGSQMQVNDALKFAVTKQREGKVDEAEHLYGKILQVAPENHVALHYLSVIRHQKGDNAQAVQLILKAIQAKPDWGEAYYNMAVFFRTMNEPGKALKVCEEGLKNCPESGQLYNMIGLLLYSTGHAMKGLPYLQKAVELRSEMKEAQNNLGLCYYALAKYDEAIKCYDRAVEIDPQYAEAYNNKGAVYLALGRIKDSLAEQDKALECRPEYPEALNNRGTCLRHLERFNEAIDSYKKALEIKPDFIDVLGNLPNLLQAMGRLDEAYEAYREALRVGPGEVNVHSNYLMCLHYMMGISREEIFREHREWDRTHCTGLKPEGGVKFNNSRDPDRKLRVGLVSGNFRRHPVGYMILPALDNTDRDKVEFYGYTAAMKGTDDFTRRISQNCVSWRTIEGLTDPQAAQLFRKHEIDILIDLSGHSEGGRLRAFAARSAPVQLEWVGGLFDTSGITEMDWILGDPVEIPEGDEKWYTERVYRMPDGYVCYEPPDYAPDIGALPALENGYVTFGCFNNLAKVTDYTIHLWSRAMQAAEGSRLYLKTKGLEDPIIAERLKEAFESHGISRDRLILENYSPHTELLECYNRVDIALDPHPYTGGLTTCEAVWMGVPVVTLPGETFAGRHGATHLNNIGLRDWIAADEDDYVRIVHEQAQNLQALAELRKGLRDKMAASPLVDGPGFAGNFETALRAMWKDWCDHGQPASERAEDRTSLGADPLPARF